MLIACLETKINFKKCNAKENKLYSWNEQIVLLSVLSTKDYGFYVKCANFYLYFSDESVCKNNVFIVL
jgi:hypothetical protein